MSEYAGPETNEVYNDEDTMETFEDLDEYDENDEDNEEQSVSSQENSDDEDEDEDKPNPEVVKKRAAKEKAKKIRGQKGDDMDSLEDDEEEIVEAKPSKKGGKKEEVEEDEEEEVETVVEDKTTAKTGKGKPTYVTVDGETFSLDSNSLVSTPVNGKNEKVSIQELKNNYAGKVAYDKKFNEINLKEQTIKRSEAQFQEQLTHHRNVAAKIKGIIDNPEANPKEAFKIFLDENDIDSYDLMERMFKSDLTDLANVLNMEPAERKAYFLEKKNSHLLDKSKKRDEQISNQQKIKIYADKVNALRNSNGVSEAQYMDALEDLVSLGNEEKDLSDKDIVEWAATKPHRDSVRPLLAPYADQLNNEVYGELSWKLANILRSGTETTETIKKHLAEVYGVPSEVRQLSKKLNSLGRRPQTHTAKPASSKKGYETFDDLNDD